VALFFSHGGTKGEMEERKGFFDRHAASWDERLRLSEHVSRVSDLVRSFELTAGSAVVDVGTGTGVLLPFLREAIGPTGRLIAMDFSLRMLEQAAERRRDANALLLNAGVHAMPLRSGEFDRVTCFAAFPHFPNKTGALLEMVRVLRPGGQLTLAHLKSAEEINQFHRQVGGAVAGDRLPDPEVLRRLMEDAGLTNVSVVNQPGRFVAQGRKG
jgi:ubiquinone/menaquinone biosynthesis C-methylase UbiE